jgi:hypothetical protein
MKDILLPSFRAVLRELLLQDTSTNKVETKIQGITLNCTTMLKVNFDVIRSLVYLHAKCNVKGQVWIHC